MSDDTNLTKNEGDLLAEIVRLNALVTQLEEERDRALAQVEILKHANQSLRSRLEAPPPIAATLDGFFLTGPLPGGPSQHLPPAQIVPPQTAIQPGLIIAGQVYVMCPGQMGPDGNCQTCGTAIGTTSGAHMRPL